MELEPQTVKERIARVGFWWHSIDVGDGVITPGHKSIKQQEDELAAMKLPDLKGKSVLDIGAWDGFFSFEAEKRGAARVLAMDYHAWHSDMEKLFQQRQQAAGGAKNGAGRNEKAGDNESTREKEVTDDDLQIWYPNKLPGRRGFDLARELRNSHIEVVDADFMIADPNTIGAFDVTFFLGVLYHIRNPLSALERIAHFTKELAIIETEAIVVPGYESQSFCEFYETNELNNDSSNWWAPNEKALLGMCRAAGFRRAEALNAPPAVPISDRLKIISRQAKPLHYRAFVHAWK